MTAEMIASDDDTMTFNEALGFTVNQYLFAHRVTRGQLGEQLGVTRTVVSKKIHGQVGWSAQDVAVVADRFGVSVDDLMPRRVEETPAAGGDGGSGSAPRTGFEPATFCSGGTLPTPDEDQGSLNLSIFRPTWHLAA